MIKIIQEFKLIFFVLSGEYIRLLKRSLSDKEEVNRLVSFSQKKFFTKMNREVFPDTFEEVAEDAESMGLKVKKAPLGNDILGVFYPKLKDESYIFLNSNQPDFLLFSTLGHEMGHACVDAFLNNEQQERRTSVHKHRLVNFKENLLDKEEVYADTMACIGSYPVELFKSHFGKMKNCKVTLIQFIKSLTFIKKYYPEAIPPKFLINPRFFLNIALILHVFRLRLFLHKEHGL